MSKVAYILGAGASYGERTPRLFENEPECDERGNVLYDITRGLPVMNEMKDAVEQLLLNIEKEKHYSACPSRQMLKNELHELYRACLKLPTIDTYASTLYARHEIDAYNKLKAQLSIAFMLWQEIGKYDQRYFTFLNNIINLNTTELPNLTILSWNYDIQMEMAFDNYVLNGNSLTKSWDELNVFCKTYPISKIPMVKKYDSTLPFALIKLNGTALFYDNDRDDRTLRFTIQDPFWHIQNKEEKYDMLYEIFSNRFTNDNSQGQHKYVNGLSYAWETDKQDELKQRIEERVSDTEVAVVIGYSFPDVNREIDRHIFGCMPNLKRIYVQDTDTNINHVKEQIEMIFDFIGRPMPTITLRDNRSFCIPNELG